MTQLFTVGYAGLGLAQLQRKLEATNGVLVDVRLVPYSRQPEWTRSALSSALGRRYRWIKALGNANYREHNAPVRLADPDAGVAAVRGLMDSHAGPLVLLCTCVDWRTCHRRNAAELICERLNLPPAIHWTVADVRGPLIPDQRVTP